MTCVPSGAPATSDGSTSDGIVASSTGEDGSSPYLDGSNERSTSSMDDAPTRIRPRSRRSSSPAAGNDGSPSSTRLTFATVPGVRMLAARQPIDGPTTTGSTSVVSSRFGSIPDTTAGASRVSPDASATPVTAPSRVVTEATRALSRISAPAARAAAASASATADGPPRANTVSPDAPPSLPAASREQHGRRPRRPRPHRRVPDAAPRGHGADRLRGEPLAHEVRDRHREHAQDRPPVLATQAAERPAQPQADERIAEARRLDVRRRLVAEVRHEPGERPHARVELDVGGRVVRGVRAQRVPRPVELGVQGDRAAVGLRREHPDLRRDEREAVLRQLELAHDRRLEPAHRVRERRDPDPAEVLGHGRAADDAARLDHHDPQPRPREVRRRRQPVVPRADDDRVVRGPAGAAGRGRAGRRRHAAAPLMPPSGRRGP